MTSQYAPLLSVQNLSIAFRTREALLHAVNDVSFELRAGETLGIVGESGSGKSVSCSALLGLLPPQQTMIAPESKAIFEGVDLLQLKERGKTCNWSSIRGQRISMIFQDPMTCLNPYIRIVDQVAEPLIIHKHMGKKQAHQLAIEELERTGIPNAAARAYLYPHEFSGGMRQRVMIAMALITRPALLIADEPTTALDVTVQKQVLDLLRERQKELGTAIILISHDLGVVKEYAHRVQVMYAGSVVESAPAGELITNPLHAYTRALLAAIPARARKGEALQSIPGMPPSLREPISGCAFRPRNIMGKAELCLTHRVPELVEHSPQHFVRNCPGCLS